jgi:Uri superfamily endonuclease
MKGTYILLMSLPERRRFRVGKLGSIVFNKGYYAYVGSAMNGLDTRISRHLRSKKKLYWHIDYLLQNASIDNVYLRLDSKKRECKIARGLGKNFQPVTNFGSSDCGCKGHLFYSKRYNTLRKAIARLGATEYKKSLEKKEGY